MSSTWRTKLVRFTVFTPLDAPLDGEQWWTKITDGTFDHRVEEPVKQRMLLRGPLPQHSNVQFSFGVQPNGPDQKRIDWLLQPTPSGQTANLGRESMGETDEVMDLGRSLILRWDRPPTAYRLAVGVVLEQIVPTSSEAAELLTPLLPFTPRSDEVDLLFRTNVPVAREVAGTRVPTNRLLTCKTEGIVEFRAEMRRSQVFVPNSETTTAYLAGVDVDVNTPPDFGEIEGTRVVPILDTYCSEARSIIEQGYRGLVGG